MELLVDNVPTLRATGECRETMRRVHWDVEAYRHRAGQIRIVDASSAGWAHINVDDFRFDWAMQEYTETPISGAAYPFRLKNIGDERACLTQYGPEFNLQCEWESQGKLVVRTHTHTMRRVCARGAHGAPRPWLVTSVCVCLPMCVWVRGDVVAAWRQEARHEVWLLG